MKTEKVVVLVLAALLGVLWLRLPAVLASPSPPPIVLDPAVNHPVGRSGNTVRDIAVADFDGDGRLDMAVPNSGDPTVSILLGEGDGTFSPAGAYTIDTGAGGNSPRFALAADFNADGKVDLAVSDNGNDEVVVLLGNGDSTFQAPVNYALGIGIGPEGMAVGDFNRDGRLDVATACSGSNSVVILRGNGNGTFQAAVNFPAGASPYGVAVGDLDGDGDQDLAVANRVNPGGTVSVLLNNGSGTFGAATSLATDVNSRSVAIGDFDRNGALDLAVANEGSQDVSVLFGNGNGAFQPATSYPAGSVPRAVAAADLNGDGVLDLAVTDGSDNFVNILQGEGDGTFQAMVPFMVGRRPDGVTVADFDADGRPDVVTANTAQDSEPFGSWNVSVLLNATTFEPTGVLAAKTDYAVGGNPDAAVAADFNRDGIPDLVAANVYSGSVSYLRGNGDGTFQAATSVSAGAYPYWVATGDFNRDGKADLAVANLTLAGTVSVLLGNGDGTFLPAASFAAGVYPVFLAAGDFNRDGRSDLAVANSGSDDVSILLGNGDGTFQTATSFGVGATPYAIAQGDFNGDGAVDLAVANFYSSSISILLGNGDGTFGLPADFDTGYNPVSVAAGDLNGDGILDLAAANYWSGDISALIGAGNGSFLPAVNYKVGVNPTAIVIGDFFRDGKPDLAVACEGSNKVFVAKGKGNGTFLAPASFATGARPAALLESDFDRDGKIDLATANWGANSVSVLLNWKDTVTTPTTPVGISLNGAAKDKGVPGMSYGFSTGGATDSLGSAVQYQFDWSGDGSHLSAWGASIRSSGWDLPGAYQVRARARSTTHPDVVSAWSGALPIDIGGPTITDLVIASGATDTRKTTETITYSVSSSATQIRTAIGGAWSAWRALPVTPHNVSLGTANGLVYVYAQVRDADGRISRAAWDTINLDTKAPTGIVQINGGSTTVRSGGASTTVRVHLAMFDATIPGAQVRVKPNATFTADPDPLAPWAPYDASHTGQDVTFTGTGVKKVFVQFADGVGLKSPVYTASITISAAGARWPGLSAVTATNLLLNGGKAYATSPAVKLTYTVSQSTRIKARYLYGTTWTAWETPAVVAGQVTKSLVLSPVNGARQVYVQLLETAGSASPGATTDPGLASLVLDTVPPSALVQVDQGVTTLRRFKTGLTYLIVSVLGTDAASGIDKIALSQTGSSVSTVPPPPDAPDWIDFAPTVESFGLNTRTLGSKSVFVWLRDRAGKVSARKVATFNVVE